MALTPKNTSGTTSGTTAVEILAAPLSIFAFYIPFKGLTLHNPTGNSPRTVTLQVIDDSNTRIAQKFDLIAAGSSAFSFLPIHLSETTQSMELVVDANPVKELDWCLFYMQAEGTFKNQNGLTTGNTAVTVVNPHATRRAHEVAVNAISVYNADSVTQTVTLQLNDNGTKRIMKQRSVAAGSFMRNDTPIKLGSSTQSVEVVLGGAVTTTEPHWIASYMEVVT